jgi:hypothetical protein
MLLLIVAKLTLAHDDQQLQATAELTLEASQLC